MTSNHIHNWFSCCKQKNALSCLQSLQSRVLGTENTLAQEVLLCRLFASWCTLLCQGCWGGQVAELGVCTSAWSISFRSSYLKRASQVTGGGNLLKGFGSPPVSRRRTSPACSSRVRSEYVSSNSCSQEAEQLFGISN